MTQAACVRPKDAWGCVQAVRESARAHECRYAPLREDEMLLCGAGGQRRGARLETPSYLKLTKDFSYMRCVDNAPTFEVSLLCLERLRSGRCGVK